MLAERHDEWAEMRRYIGLEVLTNKARLTLVENTDDTTPNEQVTSTAITA